MSMLSALLVALGLSMDNFAVTIASGCRGGPIRHKPTLLISFSFALAHILMLSAGWWGGRELGRFLDRFDHWIAFAVLVFIGGKMVKESFQEQAGPNLCHALALKTLLALAVATSLDALGVGMALSLTQAPYVLTLCFMAGCVFITSYSGFFLGAWLGCRFGKVMETLGGLVLCLVGTKVLLSGLGIW